MSEEQAQSPDVTLIFEPQSGGSVPEREPKTHTLRQFVTAVFQRLNVTNAVNPMVQKKGGSVILDLNSTVAALGLDSGDKLNLAWQASGGTE
jgi:hypothetical protein